MIETTGLADPAPVLQTLMQDPLLSEVYRLDGVIATVDAVNAMDQLDRQVESVKQVAVADRLVLTKTDLAGEIAALEARLRRLNPAAPILIAERGPHRPRASSSMPGSTTRRPRAWTSRPGSRPKPMPRDRGMDHDDHGHDHAHAEPLDRNRHDDHIRAFCLTWDRPLDWARFADWIES